MDTITVHSEVRDGKLAENIRQHIARCLPQFEGKRVTISIKRFVKTRSSNQNRFLHGVFLPAICAMFREAGSDLSVDQVKEFFKSEFGERETITLPDGATREVLKSTAKYGTIECEKAMERARAWAAEFGKHLPFPNEQWQ